MSGRHQELGGQCRGSSETLLQRRSQLPGRREIRGASSTPKSHPAKRRHAKTRSCPRKRQSVVSPSGWLDTHTEVTPPQSKHRQCIKDTLMRWKLTPPQITGRQPSSPSSGGHCREARALGHWAGGGEKPPPFGPTDNEPSWDVGSAPGADSGIYACVCRGHWARVLTRCPHLPDTLILARETTGPCCGAQAKSKPEGQL